MSDSVSWQRAFAKQAQADWTTWRLLIDSKTNLCHQCQFLQMTCEKVCKAYLLSQGSSPIDLQTSHAYIAKTLPILANHFLAGIGRHVARNKAMAFHLAAFKRLGREIELLNPAVDDSGRRPDNCEYPWKDGLGKMHVPAEFDFPSLKLLTSPIGRLLPKLLQRAIATLLT